MSGAFTQKTKAAATITLNYNLGDGSELTYTYDLEQIKKAIQKDENAVMLDWWRRLICTICCERKEGFAACLARCLVDEKCCDGGVHNCENP